MTHKNSTEWKPKQRICEWVNKKQVNSRSLFFNSFRFPYISHKTYLIHLPKKNLSLVSNKSLCHYYFSISFLFQFWCRFCLLFTYFLLSFVDCSRSNRIEWADSSCIYMPRLINNQHRKQTANDKSNWAEKRRWTVKCHITQRLWEQHHWRYHLWNEWIVCAIDDRRNEPKMIQRIKWIYWQRHQH